MVQSVSVIFSEYQPMYSPFITVFLILTFFACQKASLVLRTELLISQFSTYWNEYFPFKVRFLMMMSEDLMRKYSDSTVVSLIPKYFIDQPNSGEMIEDVVIRTCSHSRRALMP